MGTSRAERERRPLQAKHVREPASMPPVRRAGTLRIGRADDVAEREADGFAHTVMRALAFDHPTQSGLTPSTSRIRRSSSGGHGSFNDRLGGTVVDAEVQHAIGTASGGRPLDNRIRRMAEESSGRDLGGVRIHRDNNAGQLSCALDAEAFTAGTDIFVGHTDHRPGSAADDRLLAHEVGHVVQSGGGTTGTVQRRAALAPLQPARGSAGIRRKPGFGKTVKSGAGGAVTPTSTAAQVRPSDDDVASMFANASQELAVAKADPRYAMMSDMADRADRMLGKMRREPGTWEVLAPRLSELARSARTIAPGNEKEAGFGPLRRRLRVAADEADMLADRARMDNTKQKAGEKYMSEGGSGGLKALKSPSLFAPEATAKANVKDVRKAGSDLGLTVAEQTAITLFTAEDYKYINPATANSKTWMLNQRPDEVKNKHQRLDDKVDKKTKVSARSKAEADWAKPRQEEGSMHTAFALSGMGKLPVYDGKTYRGEVFNKAEFMAKFKVTKDGVTPRQTTMTRTSLSSTSKRLIIAERFGKDNIADKGGLKGYIVIWEYDLTNGRDISMMSKMEDEAEVATLPGATFTVTAARKYTAGILANQADIDSANVFIVNCRQTA